MKPPSTSTQKNSKKRHILRHLSKILTRSIIGPWSMKAPLTNSVILFGLTTCPLLASAQTIREVTEQVGTPLEATRTSEGLAFDFRDTTVDAFFVNGPYRFEVTDSQTRLSSNTPIQSVYICGRNANPNSNEVSFEDDGSRRIITMSGYNGQNGCRTLKMASPYSTIVKLGGLYSKYYRLSGFTAAGSLENLVNDLTAATGVMAITFQQARDSLIAFETHIRKTDRRHLIRLKNVLDSSIALMLNEKGMPKLPVTHRVIQENARLTMVLATVLNELMDEYEGVPNLDLAIRNLRVLQQQIRVAYGWQEGLAGSASKAYVALAAVLDLDIRSFYEYMGAGGAVDAKPMNDLLRAVGHLMVATKAKNGGDAAVKDEVKALSQVWTRADIQKVIAQLFNAPQDYSQQIQPKLRLLFMALESLSEFSSVSFLLPEDIRSTVMK